MAESTQKKKRIRLRTRREGAITTVSVMLRHPMETGRRKDPDSLAEALIPRNHIEQSVCRLNDHVVMCADIGAGISANPFLSFELENTQAGDILSIEYLDTLGESEMFKTKLTA